MENKEEVKLQLENLKEQLEEYKEVMQDTFGSYLLGITDEGKISLLSEDGEKFEFLEDKNNTGIICFRKDGGFSYKGYTISKSGTKTTVTETNIKMHEKGASVEYVDRIYGKSNYHKCDNTLEDLMSVICVVEDKYFEKLSDLINPEFTRGVASHTTEFSVHMRYFYKFQDEARTYASTMYPTHVYFNHDDISYIYDYVDGKDKLNRIYNLYKGSYKIDSKDVNSLLTGLVDLDSYNLRKKKTNNRVEKLIGEKLDDDDSKNKILEDYIMSHIDTFEVDNDAYFLPKKEEKSKVKRLIKRIFTKN